MTVRRIPLLHRVNPWRAVRAARRAVVGHIVRLLAGPHTSEALPRDNSIPEVETFDSVRVFARTTGMLCKLDSFQV